jgi:hypothetical protein
VRSPPTPEGGGTWVITPQQTTLQGADVHVNGNPFSSPLAFDISSNDTIEFHVSIGKGDADSSVIEGIEFTFARDCDTGNVLETVSLSVAWLDDCAKVEWVGDFSSLSDAEVPWIVNVTSAPLKIQFYNPDFSTSPWKESTYREFTSDSFLQRLMFWMWLRCDGCFCRYPVAANSSAVSRD